MNPMTCSRWRKLICPPERLCLILMLGACPPCIATEWLVSARSDLVWTSEHHRRQTIVDEWCSVGRLYMRLDVRTCGCPKRTFFQISHALCLGPKSHLLGISLYSSAGNRREHVFHPPNPEGWCPGHGIGRAVNTVWPQSSTSWSLAPLNADHLPSTAFHGVWSSNRYPPQWGWACEDFVCLYLALLSWHMLPCETGVHRGCLSRLSRSILRRGGGAGRVNSLIQWENGWKVWNQFLDASRISIRGCVRPSVRPSVRMSVCPSVRMSVRPYVRMSVTRYFWFVKNAWNGEFYVQKWSRRHTKSWITSKQLI